MRHGTTGIGRSDALEFLPCLRIRHMVQEGDRVIERDLRRPGARDRKLHLAQRVIGVLLTPRVSCVARERERQASTGAESALQPPDGDMPAGDSSE
jgi:hypothetical protein